MNRLVNFFKMLLKRCNETIVVLRSKDGHIRVFTKLPTIVAEESKIMLDSPINEEIRFTDLGNDEYICRGKHVKPRNVTDPFDCNGGVNCPWTEELKFPVDEVRVTSREVCLKCGKVGGGGSQ